MEIMNIQLHYQLIKRWKKLIKFYIQKINQVLKVTMIHGSKDNSVPVSLF